MEVSSKLIDSLLEVAQISAEECSRLKESGLRKQEIPYVKFKFEFDYKDGQYTRFSQTYEDFTKLQFGMYNRDIGLVDRDVIEHISGDKYSTLLEQLSKTVGIPHEQAATLLLNFLRDLVFNIFQDDDTSDLYLQEFTARFIHGLAKEPNWTISIWLSGVWVGKKQIELIDGVILRQPTSSDFEQEMPQQLMAFPNFHVDYMGVMAVLEITMNEVSESYMQAEIKNLLYLLTLYKVGEIHFLRQSKLPSRLISTTTGHWISSVGSAHINTRHSYELPRREIATFAQYYTLLKSNLKPLDSDNNYIGIAYHRYKEALSDRLTESCIASAISCLEALYLEGKDELKHRLCQRVTVVVKQKTKVSGLDIYEKMKTAYDIRSSYVHGVVSKKTSKYELSKIILDFARKSLLIFLQLQKTKNKKEFITMIDNSLLDEATHKELKALIKPIVIT
jgi:hypothetical protein